jgi:hypothetical protein
VRAMRSRITARLFCWAIALTLFFAISGPALAAEPAESGQR